MHQRLNGRLSLAAEYRGMGGIFWIPLMIMSLNLTAMLLWSSVERQGDIEWVRMRWGLLTFPWLMLWTIQLFHPVADAPGKEAMLVLPYRHLSYGIGRLTKALFFYALLFYGGWYGLSVSFKLFPHWAWYDTSLPFVSLLFLASFAFITIILTQNFMHSYIVIGAFCISQCITRGSIAKGVYPFHWAWPHAVRSHKDNLYILLCVAGLFLLVGQLCLKNREFMSRKS